MQMLLVCYAMISMMQWSVSEDLSLYGQLLERHSNRPIPNAMLTLEGTSIQLRSDVSGSFHMAGLKRGSYILKVTSADFVEKRFPIELTDADLDLGIIHLELDIPREQTENLITLNEAELSENEEYVSAAGLLQATRDVYLSRAAFDFSQAFFRIRGYDSSEGTVLLNGHKMNKFADGRPQWNNWGGLNDITRNQELSFGLKPASLSFGSLLGVTNIKTRPTVLRPGTRVSASMSNRTYTGRLMATYSSGKSDKRLSYAVSGSRRWGKSGFLDGTLYRAYALYGSLEYELDSTNTLNFSALIAANRRGQSAAVTEEVHNLTSNKYNPYWGHQNGRIRNSRVRKIQEPILMLNYHHLSARLQLTTGIAYQFGSRSKSRLGYYNAPNPDPTYYKYLPSYYINSPIGASFTSAAMAKSGFQNQPQISWERLYRANTSDVTANRKAAYIIYDDTLEEKVLSLVSMANLKLCSALTLDIGMSYRKSGALYYAKIDDLLGAQWHEDMDPFSNTVNDLNGDLMKRQGDTFNYNYRINSQEVDAFLQLRAAKIKWDAFISGKLTTSSFHREGYYKNERYPMQSHGKSRDLKFLNYGGKAGVIYKISGRQWVAANAIIFKRAPIHQNAFINPREHNIAVPDISSEKISSADFGYHFRFPEFKGRLTVFYTRFQKGTDINFFFVDSGLGSDFVQEVITNQDKLHKGAELSLKYQISSAVGLTFAGSLANYLFASDPDLSIYFDPSGQEEDAISADGHQALGIANIKDYNLARGPQKAFSLGLDYRDPKYWWIGITANYLMDNYIGVSTINRTSGFLLDPDTAEVVPGISQESIAPLLKQLKLTDFYLLNFIAGKSWLKKGKYISVFASINNVFNTAFKTGGYEQSRNGNYLQLAKDNLSGSPSFGPKFWYGYGRTFFFNVALSF
ncbi:MAG: TonB-dependent receptor [Eudoraea sp.]|nr:TonB-dependent receptor [Eudoraea sp.]